MSLSYIGDIVVRTKDLRVFSAVQKFLTTLGFEHLYFDNRILESRQQKLQTKGVEYKTYGDFRHECFSEDFHTYITDHLKDVTDYLNQEEINALNQSEVQITFIYRKYTHPFEEMFKIIDTIHWLPNEFDQRHYEKGDETLLPMSLDNLEGIYDTTYYFTTESFSNFIDYIDLIQKLMNEDITSKRFLTTKGKKEIYLALQQAYPDNYFDIIGLEEFTNLEDLAGQTHRPILQFVYNKLKESRSAIVK